LRMSLPEKIVVFFNTFFSSICFLPSNRRFFLFLKINKKPITIIKTGQKYSNTLISATFLPNKTTPSRIKNKPGSADPLFRLNNCKRPIITKMSAHQSDNKSEKLSISNLSNKKPAPKIINSKPIMILDRMYVSHPLIYHFEANMISYIKQYNKEQDDTMALSTFLNKNNLFAATTLRNTTRKEENSMGLLAAQDQAAIIENRDSVAEYLQIPLEQ